MNEKKLTGILWILVVVTVFTSLAITLQYDITLNVGDMEKTLQNVAKFPIPHIIDLVFDVISNTLLIIVGVLLYFIFKKETKALFGSLWFIIGGSIMVIHNMGNFAVTWIARDYVLAAGAEAAALKASAYATLLTAKWGVSLASFFFVLGVIVYSSMIIKSSKFVGWFGIIAGLLALPALIVAWISPEFEMLSYRLYGPMLIWQITFGLWLMRKKTVIN